MILLLTTLAGFCLHAAERQLPVRRGLYAWYDAQTLGSSDLTQNAQRDANTFVETWADQSGNGRDVIQPNPKWRPELVRIDKSQVVRFDGESQYFRRSTPDSGSASALTFFIVAAPHENLGDFRGLIAANGTDQRDYESGFTIDLGPGPTLQWDTLNVEGRGFGGARDLMKPAFLMGTLHTVEVAIDAAQNEVRLAMDGRASDDRPMSENELSISEWTVGARYYTNGPGAQAVRGFFAGDLAEVIVYDRILSTDEAKQIRDYLNYKYQDLAKNLPQELTLKSPGVPLVKVENPPAIQMLVPGFRVSELPVELSNVNNVRFREDGRLMTLGYNGDVHLLSDTNGDGLEDHADLFWKNTGSIRGPIGIQLTPPNYALGRGLFVPSKGKVSLIIDTNGDDVADEEKVIASGWKEIPQNVDAVGIAMDDQGALYFGLGTANYANAYLVDDSGNAKYDISSDRGTVQRISPDFSRRETVCTGIRFPIAFAFNRAGDLFCTEQEGATWLPNGNPFDELLHIQPNRHYGFPPRHPRHNPDVIDEPSTFDYAPQHQSTCGMVFNESVNGGPVFGPSTWAGDAIVCGESRGKIWRTKLEKTPSGYIAMSQLIAALQFLTVDACVAPNGDLVVACHSGPPDWGTGPTGIGRLFRIHMHAPEMPRPVLAWAESPQEIRIALDRPIDPIQLKAASDAVRIEYGDYVRAADRFEHLVPPYAVVKHQSVSPRYVLPVYGLSVTPDFRTLILQTAVMRSSVHYAVTLPFKSDAPLTGAGITPLPNMDVDLALHGVQANWRSKTSSDLPSATWSGWLPHLDMDVSRSFTTGSAVHEQLAARLHEAGELELKTRLDVRSFLRPRIQPGASIDYEWPKESTTVLIESNTPLEVQCDDQPVPTKSADSNVFKYAVSFAEDTPAIALWKITVPTGGRELPRVHVSVSTKEDARSRPIPLERFLLPWSALDTTYPNAPVTNARPEELTGGNWGRGRSIFNSQAAGCFKCHAIDGTDVTIGPHLGNLIHRDYASVRRDILFPSYTINPDHIGHSILLRNGQILTGVLRSDAGRLILGDEKGKLTTLDPQQIEEIKPVTTSVMPTGLEKAMTEDQLRDLLTYLLTPAPHMPLDSKLAAPPIRTRAEVASVLADAPENSVPTRPLQIVLIAGKKDHGPGEHDYPAWQNQWGQLLAAAADVNVSAAWDFPSEEQLATADIVIFFQKGDWDDARAKGMDDYFARGGGAVYIHWAVNGNERVAEFSKRIGLASRGGKIRFRHGPLTLDLHNTDHPILRNLEPLELYDESYWLLTGEPQDVTLLASSQEDGAAQPQVWTYEQGTGRVFVSVPGHYNWTFDDPLFRILLLRGIAWTAKEPVDRFNELVPLGARISR